MFKYFAKSFYNFLFIAFSIRSAITVTKKRGEFRCHYIKRNGNYIHIVESDRQMLEIASYDISYRMYLSAQLNTAFLIQVSISKNMNICSYPHWIPIISMSPNVDIHCHFIILNACIRNISFLSSSIALL